MSDLLKKFYEGKTTRQEEDILFNTKHENAIDQKNLQAQDEYFKAFRNIKPDNEWLARYKRTTRRRMLWSSPVRLAASLLIVIVMYGTGYLSYHLINKPAEQISQLQLELMQSRLTLIEETLSKGNAHSTRKGLALVSQLSYVDDRITDELVVILNSSDNVNLRLLALEQLSRHINTQTTREKIFSSISAQDSELVLAELARIAIIVRNKQAAHKILEQMEKIREENAADSFPLKKELEVLL